MAAIASALPVSRENTDTPASEILSRLPGDPETVAIADAMVQHKKSCPICGEEITTEKVNQKAGQYYGMIQCDCIDKATCEHTLVCKKHGARFARHPDLIGREPGLCGHAPMFDDKHCTACRLRFMQKCVDAGMCKRGEV